MGHTSHNRAAGSLQAQQRRRIMDGLLTPLGSHYLNCTDHHMWLACRDPAGVA